MEQNNKTKTGIELIADERQRQVDKEGWTSLHDNGHSHREMQEAAAAYITSSLKKATNDSFRFQRYQVPETDLMVNDGDRGDRMLDKGGWQDGWPWDAQYDKRDKHDELRSLVIAGALIAAEIDRLNQLSSKQEPIITPRENLSCAICGYFCNNDHHFNNWFNIEPINT